MKKLVLTLLSVVLFSCAGESQIFNDWRGPDRDGYYPETNLLKEWPENGPEMKWAYEELGKGFTSPVIKNGKIYITGMEGDMGYVYIMTMDGELFEKYPYGKEDSGRYPGTRSTPTIIDNLMYVATGEGELICLDLNDGNIKWKRDLFSDFDSRNIRWGFTESLIIDGDMLYCSPGGSIYNIVALNRHTGRLIWSSEGKGGLSAYCSPLLFEHNGRKVLATHMQRNVVALDARTGKLLWSHPHANNRNIHPNTPIYKNGYLYCVSGYGHGGEMLKLSETGESFTKVWENSTLDPKMGSVIIKDGYIYGSGDRNRRWFVLDWKTGEITYESRDIDVGNVIFADGLLYTYTERGELALLEPLDGKFRIISQTNITLGSDQHWAHLVINDGILYVRRGNALMAFDIGRS